LVSVEVLLSLHDRIYEKEKMQDDWKKGLLLKFPKKRDSTCSKN